MELLRPRRILASLAIFVLLGGSGIGIASVAATDAAEALAFPAPAHGDEGVLRYAAIGQVANTSFSWAGPVAWHGPNGGVVSALALRVDDPDAEWDEALFEVRESEAPTPRGPGAHFLPPQGGSITYVEAGVPIAGGPMHRLASASASSTSSAGSARAESTTWQSVEGFEPDGFPCAAVHGLQGRAYADEGRILVYGDCGDGQLVRHMAVVGPVRMGDVRGLHLRGEVDVYLGNGHAMPLLVRGAVTEMRLAAFSAGDGHPPEAGAPNLPAVGVAPRGQYGPDTGGAFQVYPLESAVLDARLGDASLLAWTESHDWWVHAAAYYTPADAYGTKHTWRILLAATDGSGYQIRIHAYQAGSHQGLGDATVARAYTTVQASPEHVGSVDLPTQLPRLADAQAAWSALTGEQNPRFWSFELPGCAACGDGELIVGSAPSVAWASSYASLVTGTFADGPPDGVSMRYDVQGSYQGLLRIRTVTESWGGLPLVSDDSQPQAVAPVASLAFAEPEPWVAAGITLGALAVALGYWLWPTLKSMVGVGLFSRVHGPVVLEHPVRRRIMDLVEAEPGIHYQDLMRATGKGKGTMEHHLRKLTESNLLVQARAHGFTCYFPRGTVDHDVMQALPVLRSRGARQVLQAVMEHPGVNAQAIAVQVGLSTSTASHHLKRLREAGLVDATRGADGLCLRPTAMGQKAYAAS